MSLHKLARELDETARQTALLVEGVSEALATLAQPQLGAAEARTRAAAQIVQALQGQDRIEQRCRDLALAIRHFAALPAGTSEADLDAIWRSLTLDELRVPELSGIAQRSASTGDVDLF